MQVINIQIPIELIEQGETAVLEQRDFDFSKTKPDYPPGETPLGCNDDRSSILG